ncbi:IS630 family transposase [Aeromonas hydrophila]
MPILPPLPRPQRRRIHKIIHATRDKGHARRLMAILLLHEGRTITDVHHLTGTARSTIGRWLRWYRDEGVGALEALPAGRAPILPVAKIVTLLVLLMQFSPQDFGYQRSRWCTELLAIKINRLMGLNMAASTLRRWLPRMGIVWRRPVPTLRIKDPAYQEKMANIDAALARCDADNPVFYEDEVDIDLNPKLGADWMFRAQQKRVVTPGKNAKHYLAGVLHAGNGRVLYVSGIKKNSSLFIAMLEKLRRHYRRAKTITLILDNYIIHKSKQTERWLKKNPKFCLVFQPVYSPWVNHIERLWHKLHETITRNHQCRGMASLLARVKHFMDTVSPFPGNGYGTAKV